ncbi:MAG: hypothetical protein E7510_09685 [Ruminococcus sp.]|nr:hypothetical protein [Ruminococcus sp.]
MIKIKDNMYHNKENNSFIFVYDRKKHISALKKLVLMTLIFMAIIPVVYLFFELSVGAKSSVDPGYIIYVSIALLQLVMFIGVMILLLFGGKFMRMCHTCSEFEICSDRLVIDKRTFLLADISDCFITPFEYHAHRKVSFKHKGKKYIYYFGEYAQGAYQKSNIYFNAYIELCDILERKGFACEY